MKGVAVVNLPLRDMRCPPIQLCYLLFSPNRKQTKPDCMKCVVEQEVERQGSPIRRRTAVNSFGLRRTFSRETVLLRLSQLGSLKNSFIMLL
ncbi:unnamed protein product [Nezara viridula]|uniref:Uncharacterized protein n=1 Tax=Nezara viridula TaxID=85310 RepID=A0A9P0H1H1_NEZVI|nr:unnamed protein product [Nezara viridula]